MFLRELCLRSAICKTCLDGAGVPGRLSEMLNLIALQQLSLWLGVIIAVALFAGLLIPYLFEEIWRGKADLGPSLPTGAPAPAEPIPQAAPSRATLSLQSFHLVLILLSIVLASGTGVWGLFNRQLLLGAVSLGVAILLVAYWAYLMTKAENVRLAD